MARARAAAAWVSAVVVAAVRWGLLGHPGQQPGRHHQEAAQHHRRQRRDLRFELQLFHPLLQPPLQVVGAFASLARVQPGVGLAGLLLQA